MKRIGFLAILFLALVSQTVMAQGVWIGLANSTAVQDRESELQARCGSFTRINISEPAAWNNDLSYNDLCSSVGKTCVQVCDWTGSVFSCSENTHTATNGVRASWRDGTRIAFCADSSSNGPFQQEVANPAGPAGQQPVNAAPPQQTDNGAAQRAALEQQKQDIADKIADLQSDIEQHQSAAEDWDNTAENAANSGCSGPAAAICQSIAQIGVAKARSNANKERQAAQHDQAEINRLQGNSGDLDQQINSLASTPAAQPSAYDANAIVNAGNRQAAQIRAIGNANAAAQNNNRKPAAASPQEQKGCWDGKGGIIPGSENWKACPGW